MTSACLGGCGHFLSESKEITGVITACHQGIFLGVYLKKKKKVTELIGKGKEDASTMESYTKIFICENVRDLNAGK